MRIYKIVPRQLRGYKLQVKYELCLRLSNKTTTWQTIGCVSEILGFVLIQKNQPGSQTRSRSVETPITHISDSSAGEQEIAAQ